MKFSAVSLFLTVASAAVSRPKPQVKSYSGYKVFRVPVGTDASKVSGIVNKLGLTTWKGAPRAGTFADIVVPPTELAAFEQEVTGMEVVTMHEDLGASIDEQNSFGAYAAGTANSTWFNAYHSYADHLQFLRDLQAQYPTQSEIVTSGNSGNGNPITGIHFWGSSGKGKKPAVVLHGTVHAREWVSTLVSHQSKWTRCLCPDSDICGF